MKSLTMLPGRLAVVYPLELARPFEIEARVRREIEQLHGGPYETRHCEVVASGIPELEAGDEVIVRCDAPCLALEPHDYPWVPAGSEVRVYGVHEPVGEAVIGRCE